MTRLSLPFESARITPPNTGLITIFRASASVDYGFLPQTRLHAVQSFKPEADGLQSRGMTVSGQPPANCAMSLVHLTKSKSESLGQVARALTATDVGGLVLVDGVKTDGIDSVLKRCRDVLDIVDVKSKAHGKIFWMARPESLPASVTDWAAALTPSQKPHGFFTAPGMFSPDKIDVGSALLADSLSGVKGRVADLGAGWGWLAHQALTHPNVSTIDLFEAEETALNCARLNISDTRAAFHWQDVTNMPVDADFDSVICNPPFHQGRAAEPSLGTEFITKAAEMLRPNGALWLVANRHLPYENPLRQNFAHSKTVKETTHFKVICASRPLHHRKRR